MEGFDCPMETGTVRSRDGTSITYYIAGSGKVPWVLAPGLGTNIYCWKYLFEHFQTRFWMVTWDPRGTYRSAVPADLSRLRLEDHVDDMEVIVEALGLKRFISGGWSMGVEIALEHCHRHPESVRGLTLINGAYEHVLKTALGLPGAEHILIMLLKSAQVAVPYIGPAVTMFFEWDDAVRVLATLGLVSKAAVHEDFRRVLREFSRMDWGVYLHMVELLNQHSSASYLHEINVPTLITAGTDDVMTPLSTAYALNNAIRGSRLHVVPGGTHYTMMEFPQELHRGIEEFLMVVAPEAFDSRPKRKRR